MSQASSISIDVDVITPFTYCILIVLTLHQGLLSKPSTKKILDQSPPFK